MKNKILKTHEPIINTNAFHSILLSIIMNNKDSYKWIYNNYIQLESHKLINSKPINSGIDFCNSRSIYDSCPYISTFYYPSNLITKGKDIINLIIDWIDLDYYLQMFLNYYYLTSSNYYQKEKMLLNTFIYGYNKKEQVFYIAHHFDDGKFSHKKISFCEFQTAYDNIENTNNFHIEKVDKIRLIKLKSNVNFKFSFELMLMFIKDYLNGKNSYLITNSQRDIFDDSQRKYGINVYGVLIQYFKLLLDKKINNDYRGLHFLYEHKKLMSNRIIFLLENNFIKNDKNDLSQKFINLEKEIQVLRNMQIKYEITKNDTLIKKIIVKLDKLYFFDRDLMTEFIKALEYY